MPMSNLLYHKELTDARHLILALFLMGLCGYWQAERVGAICLLISATGTAFTTNSVFGVKMVCLSDYSKSSMPTRTISLCLSLIRHFARCIMFKKFLVGALTALMVVGFGAFTEANQSEQCCRGGYYCASDCDNYDGDYCGRYGYRR